MFGSSAALGKSSQPCRASPRKTSSETWARRVLDRVRVGFCFSRTYASHDPTGEVRVPIADTPAARRTSRAKGIRFDRLALLRCHGPKNGSPIDTRIWPCGALFMNAMKTGVCVAITVAVGGCTTSEPVYRLIVEDATLSSGSTNAHPPTAGAPSWCTDGSEPAFSAIARTRSAHGRTTERSGTLTPSWNETVMVAAQSDFSAGIRVDIVGACKNGEVHVGAARVLPGPNVFQGMSLVVKGFGGAQELQLRWQLLHPIDVPGGYYYDGGYWDDVSSPAADPSSSDSTGSADDQATCDSSGDCYDTTPSTDGTTDAESGSTDSGSSDSADSDSSSADSGSADSSSSDSSSCP